MEPSRRGGSAAFPAPCKSTLLYVLYTIGLGNRSHDFSRFFRLRRQDSDTGHRHWRNEVRGGIGTGRRRDRGPEIGADAGTVRPRGGPRTSAQLVARSAPIARPDTLEAAGNRHLVRRAA